MRLYLADYTHSCIMHVVYVERHSYACLSNLKPIYYLLNNAHLLFEHNLYTCIDGVSRFISLEHMGRPLPLRILFLGDFNRPFGIAYRTSTAYHGFILLYVVG